MTWMKYIIKMVKVVLAPVLFFICASTSSAWTKNVAVNEKNFPNVHFRHYIEIRFDTNRDGVLNDKERKAVTELDTGSSSYYRRNLGYPAPDTLKGIEYFPNLKKLNCSNNRLTSLDVSGNRNLEELRCEYNKLDELNVTNNEKLKILWCGSNRLETLDVSQNIKLVELWCSYNQISEIDLKNNEKLEVLDIDSNGLKALDVRNLEKLESLFCYSNKLKKLDVTKNKKLKDLDCGDNGLKKLDVTHNPALSFLYCHDNKLRRLDLSHNKRLNELNCRDNCILTGNLGISSTQLGSFDFTIIGYGVATSKQTATIKRKKIGKYYYIPLSDLEHTRGITNLSAGTITKKGIRLNKGKVPKVITYEYNMFTGGKKLTKVKIQVKK